MGNKARGTARPRPAKASTTAATKAATVAKTTVAPKTSSRAADTTPADVAVAGDDAVPFDPLAIGTIDDDGQVPVVYEPDDDDDGGSVPLRTKGASKPGAKSELNPSFTFEIDGGDVGRLGPPKSWDFTTAKEALRASMAARARPGVSELSSIDAKIARKKREMKEEISSSAKRVRKGDAGEGGEVSGDESEANGESDELGSAKGLEEDAGSDASDEEGREDAEDAESEDDPAEDNFSGAEEDEEGTMARAVADDDEDVDDIVHDRRKAEYFAEEPSVTSSDGPQSFTDMRLSRPVLKAIADMGFVKPTAIQARSIPLALQGLDICGAAMTGSGKTGAFIVPVLERLLYRPKNVPATRVLVLVPTRELGVQCHSVATNLAKYTDIQLCLCVGGLSNKLQEAELKKRPDVVIATPGRLIDHIHNSMSFNLESIEILIIDEADRILEDGFADELNEIIKSTPKTRQTMLFSATMTDNVDDLIRLSLNRPVRLFVDKTNTLTNRLVQEFVRVRSTKEESRAAMLIALCQRTYTSQAIVFFRSKAAAHQMKIVFGLCGLLAAELHGNLTQLQRLEALESFRDGKVNFLLATDLAARGLDISGVKTVINFDMPRSYAQYVHRVGRTARAERAGRAVSFVGEADRKVLKLALKGSHDAVKSRVIPAAVVARVERRLDELRAAVKDIEREEENEKEIQAAELKVSRMENLLLHEDEIKSRPARTWFQSPSEKQASKELGLAKHRDDFGLGGQDGKLGGPGSKLTRRKKRLNAAREDEGAQRAQKAAARAAKRDSRTGKLTHLPSKGAGRGGGGGAGAKKGSGRFAAEERSKKAGMGVRGRGGVEKRSPDPNNPRVAKALIAAKYNGVEVEVVPVEMGVTNKTPEFLKKFPLGKVPAFESATGFTLYESNAIAYYVASYKEGSKLLGANKEDAARIQQFIALADNEITPANATWLFPILGWIPNNEQNTKKAIEDTKKFMGALNAHLLHNTYLAGENITLADISVSIALINFYRMVFDPEFRSAFKNVNRWFTTLINQENFKTVLGEVSLCEKAQVAPVPTKADKKEKKEEKKETKKEVKKEEKKEKKEEPKKEEKKKAKEEDDDDDMAEFQDEKPKEKNPLDLLPKSNFNLEEWKRFYSNNDTRPTAMNWLWEKFDPEGFCIYRLDYKYNSELTLTFMSSNLVGGFFHRLEAARKYAFGSLIVLGTDNNNSIAGYFIYRGHGVPEVVVDCPDYESWNFTPVDHKDPAQRELIAAYLAWDEVIEGKKFADGKVFK